jgi:hypothetical protein
MNLRLDDVGMDGVWFAFTSSLGCICVNGGNDDD